MFPGVLTIIGFRYLERLTASPETQPLVPVPAAPALSEQSLMGRCCERYPRVGQLVAALSAPIWGHPDYNFFPEEVEELIPLFLKGEPERARIQLTELLSLPEQSRVNQLYVLRQVEDEIPSRRASLIETAHSLVALHHCKSAIAIANLLSAICQIPLESRKEIQQLTEKIVRSSSTPLSSTCVYDLVKKLNTVYHKDAQKARYASDLTAAIIGLDIASPDRAAYRPDTLVFEIIQWSLTEETFSVLLRLIERIGLPNDDSSLLLVLISVLDIEGIEKFIDLYEEFHESAILFMFNYIKSPRWFTVAHKLLSLDRSTPLANSLEKYRVDMTDSRYHFFLEYAHTHAQARTYVKTCNKMLRNQESEKLQRLERFFRATKKVDKRFHSLFLAQCFCQQGSILPHQREEIEAFVQILQKEENREAWFNDKKVCIKKLFVITCIDKIAATCPNDRSELLRLLFDNPLIPENLVALQTLAGSKQLLPALRDIDTLLASYDDGKVVFPAIIDLMQKVINEERPWVQRVAEQLSSRDSDEERAHVLQSIVKSIRSCEAHKVSAVMTQLICPAIDRIFSWEPSLGREFLVNCSALNLHVLDSVCLPKKIGKDDTGYLDLWVFACLKLVERARAEEGWKFSDPKLEPKFEQTLKGLGKAYSANSLSRSLLRIAPSSPACHSLHPYASPLLRLRNQPPADYNLKEVRGLAEQSMSQRALPPYLHYDKLRPVDLKTGMCKGIVTSFIGTFFELEKLDLEERVRCSAQQSTGMLSCVSQYLEYALCFDPHRAKELLGVEQLEVYSKDQLQITYLLIPWGDFSVNQSYLFQQSSKRFFNDLSDGVYAISLNLELVERCLRPPVSQTDRHANALIKDGENFYLVEPNAGAFKLLAPQDYFEIKLYDSKRVILFSKVERWSAQSAHQPRQPQAPSQSDDPQPQ